MVRFVRVLGRRISESLFINCLNVSASGTISVIIMLATITFHGEGKIFRSYANLIQKANKKYEPPINKKK